MSAGWYHNLALTRQGTVYALGRNTFGESGIKTDSTTFGILRPVLITSLTDVISIAAGRYQSYAKDKAGQIWSWGKDIGPVPKKIQISSQLENFIFSPKPKDTLI